MVSTVVGSAVSLAANALPNPVSSDKTEDQPKYTHWSEYVLIAGSIVAVIATVAFSILGMIPMAVICGVMVATQLIGFYYIRQFMPLKSMEDISSSMDGVANKLAADQKTIQVATAQINAVQSQAAKNIADDSKTLAETHQKTLDELTQLKTANANLALKLQDAETSNTATAKLYADLQVRCQKLDDLLNEYIQNQQKISNATATIDVSNKAREANTKQLVEGLQKLNEEVSKQSPKGHGSGKELAHAVEALTNSENTKKQVVNDATVAVARLTDATNQIPGLIQVEKDSIVQMAKLTEALSKIPTPPKQPQATPPKLPATLVPPAVLLSPQKLVPPAALIPQPPKKP